jgi:hypothetical protein
VYNCFVLETNIKLNVKGNYFNLVGVLEYEAKLTPDIILHRKNKI